MSIRVTFMGVIATVTREKDCVLPSRASLTVRDVLDGLEARYGAEFGRRVFRSETPPRPLQMHTRVFVNGQLVDDAALDQPLTAAGDEPGASDVLIYLLPAATGG